MNIKSIPYARLKGHLMDIYLFRKSPTDYLLKCKEIYGDTFISNLLYKEILITSNPKAIRYVLQTNSRNYVKHIGYRQLKQSLGKGLLVSEGELWLQQRRLIQPTFHKKHLNALFDTIVSTSDIFLEEFEKHRGNLNSIDIANQMNILTSNIALNILFTNNNYDNNILSAKIARCQNYIVNKTRYSMFPFLPYINGSYIRFQRDVRCIDKIIYRVIDSYRKSKKKESGMLSMLIATKMPDKQIRDELITFYTAGYETSANALSWIWYLLMQNPNIYEQLKNEVRTVLGNRPPKLEDLVNLSYTYQVIQEAMRLYPPAWGILRRAVDNDSINGYSIKKGTLIFISTSNLHRDERHWKSPEIFNPTRFSPITSKNRDRGVYMPFGLGQRMCIGNNLALMEIQLLVAVLCQHFDFKLDERHIVEPQALITLRAKNGIKAWVR